MGPMAVGVITGSAVSPGLADDVGLTNDVEIGMSSVDAGIDEYVKLFNPVNSGSPR